MCGSDGKWNGNLDNGCTPIECGYPVLHVGTEITNCSGTTYSSECVITCSKGFKSRTSKQAISLSCSRDAQWIGTYPLICDPIQCDTTELSRINNNNIKYQCSNDNNIIGTNCYFTCDETFTLFGNSNLVCRESGLWTSKPPVCVDLSQVVRAKIGQQIFTPSSLSECNGVFTFAGAVGVTYDIIATKSQSQPDFLLDVFSSTAQPLNSSRVNDHHILWNCLEQSLVYVLISPPETGKSQDCQTLQLQITERKEGSDATNAITITSGENSISGYIPCTEQPKYIWYRFDGYPGEQFKLSLFPQSPLTNINARFIAPDKSSVMEPLSSKTENVGRISGYPDATIMTWEALQSTHYYIVMGTSSNTCGPFSFTLKSSRNCVISD